MKKKLINALVTEEENNNIRFAIEKLRSKGKIKRASLREFLIFTANRIIEQYGTDTENKI